MTLQGAIKQLHELRCNEDMPIFFKPVIAEVINVLLMDAEEARHGKWEQVGDNTYRCSVCGEISCCNSQFCSECGAKMDEVEE